MDGRRFDAWTRVLAGVSRRDALKTLVAGAVAGPLTVAGARGTLAQVTPQACGRRGDNCDRDSDCCSRFECHNGECRKEHDNNRCGRKGDNCDRDSDCCSGFECRNGECERDNRCGRDGDNCDRDSDCCSDFECRNDECRRTNCADRGEDCDRDSDCCSNLECRNGECRRD